MNRERLAVDASTPVDECVAHTEAWVHEHVPIAWRDAAARGGNSAIREVRSRADYEAWYPVFGASGLVMPTWAPEYGGLGVAPETATAMRVVLTPFNLRALNPLGLNNTAAALFAYGTDEQKLRFLGPIVRNEEKWCQLFSEPGAGSDLASLATKAVRDGDEWLVSGQKVWTTWAQEADFAILLARTDPSRPKNKGITYFLVDMHAAGVDVRPLRHISGEIEFNEVFLDQTRVPDFQRLGDVNDGWRVAGATLSSERQMVAGAGSGGSGRVGGSGVDRLLQLARKHGLADDPIVRQRLAALWSEERIRAWTNQRVASNLAAGQTPGPAASIGKVHQAGLNQRVQAAAVELLGTGAMAWDVDGVNDQHDSDAYHDSLPFEVGGMLRSRANTIEGGTTEVNKNILGERVLGLPREPDAWLGKPWSEIPPLMSRDWAAVIAGMTLAEKTSLTNGVDFWNLAAIERLGIPSIQVTDGPNGARGSALFGLGSQTSVCVPCGSALGATWDPALIERVGIMLGEETHTKACRVLLAPTVNIHRSPLAGRNFECYSEDPLLSGAIAAAFVRGVQSQGIVTTVKHFAGNDSEFERNSINSVIDPRALREIYLVPFEMAVRDGGALGVMTAYNRLNGPHCSEHTELLDGILRGEWGFEGFVLTDWMSAGSTVGSSTAGVDLEMPGPGSFFGTHLADAVRAGEVDEAVVDTQVEHLLRVFERIGALDDPPERTSTSVDRPEHRALAREAAAAAMVLLENDGVLPFDRSSLRSVAVIGPNAQRPQMMGGGSANLAPHYRISPLDALRVAFGDAVDVRYERALDFDVTAPPVDTEFSVDWFAGPDHAGAPVATTTFRDGRLLLVDTPPAGVDVDDFSFRATGRYTPDETGTHRVTSIQMGGSTRVLLDGVVVLDGIADPPGPGDQFFGFGSAEVEAAVELVAGRSVDLVVEFVEHDGFFLRGMKLGVRQPSPPDLLDRAVAAARDADAVVVVVGTNADWETEGRDRETMHLPGAQDDLVERVVAANPNTVVVVNTGAPVAMPWADDARAVLQAWFGGQEMAHALADILLGDAEPGGRLPTTLPVLLEHNPSFGNFPGENGEVRYGEGVLVGYRWYEARHLPTRFPFGHGLSYTSFALGEPEVGVDGDRVTVSVPVTNTGDRRGSEVVQCYVGPPQPSRLVRPPKELKAFAKVALDPGEQTTVALALDERAFAYWDPGDPRTDDATPGWRVDPGTYTLHVGRSSADISSVLTVER